MAGLPALSGAIDVDSPNGNIQPWLRSLDGLNTHDDAYESVIAGGVTTGVVLPGSENSIGGQAFVIKYRPTAEKTPTSMLLEPPHSIVNGTHVDPSLPPRWRQMKFVLNHPPLGYSHLTILLDMLVEKIPVRCFSLVIPYSSFVQAKFTLRLEWITFGT